MKGHTSSSYIQANWNHKRHKKTSSNTVSIHVSSEEGQEEKHYRLVYRYRYAGTSELTGSQQKFKHGTYILTYRCVVVVVDIVVNYTATMMIWWVGVKELQRDTDFK